MMERIVFQKNDTCIQEKKLHIQKKKIQGFLQLLVFSPFLSIIPKLRIKEKRKKYSVTREGASTSAKGNSTRRFMILKVNNPRTNYIVESSREFANLLKIRKECNKSGYMLARRRMAKESKEL